ncbi:MAG TPA: SGNH/GDSL hydrolase family protein [Microlunatus sp.]|nr:SGNH/GDSL hydrolase family protein [Microlunatus sp.]
MSRRGRSRTTGFAVIGVLLAVVVTAIVTIPRLLGSAVVDSAPPAATPTNTATAHPTGGDRTGPIRLVGFGDSVMAGTACDCDDFLTQVGHQLAGRTGRAVTTINNGANGETAAGVLQELRTDDAVAAEISAAGVIVVTIGANDLGPALDEWQDRGCDAACYQPEIQAMGQRLSDALTVLDRHKPAATPVLVTSYWNVFEDGDVGLDEHGVAYPAWSDRVTRAANRAICAAAERAAAGCVDLYRPFKGDGGQDPTTLLADDGDHPNDTGTTVIADTVTAAIDRRLSR